MIRSSKPFSIGRILARHVKMNVLGQGWLTATTIDLGRVDEVLSVIPDDTSLGGRLNYVPKGKFILLSTWLNAYGEHIDFVSFVRNGPVGFVCPTVLLNRITGIFEHPNQTIAMSEISFAETEVSRESDPIFLPPEDGEKLKEFDHLGERSLCLLDYLLRGDFARIIEDGCDGATVTARAVGLPTYRVLRKRVDVDWWAMRERAPSRCEVGLPRGGRVGTPQHEVWPHWCERQMSGNPRCEHEWHYFDEAHKECVKCERYSWLRRWHLRGDERFGKIVHDYDGAQP